MVSWLFFSRLLILASVYYTLNTFKQWSEIMNFQKEICVHEDDQVEHKVASSSSCCCFPQLLTQKKEFSYFQKHNSVDEDDQTCKWTCELVKFLASCNPKIKMFVAGLSGYISISPKTNKIIPSHPEWCDLCVHETKISVIVAFSDVALQT